MPVVVEKGAEGAPYPALNPSMSVAEFKCLWSYLIKARCYVEFGSGGSTLAAIRAPSVISAWSVESDADWASHIRKHPEITAAEETARLTLRCIDIGPVTTPGYPTDWASAPKWSNYYTSIWKDAKDPELVLIDGRFRVACALSAFRHCSSDVHILIHDFWDRPQYHAVLEFAHTVASAERMVVLQRKDTIDWHAMCELALRFALDPS